jgi:GDPmannose 4,6-dehydratase
MAFAHAGVEIRFEGKEENEKAIVTAVDNDAIPLQPGEVVVEVDKRYFRPTEVDLLIGDASKAKTKLGWSARYTVNELVKEMVDADIEYFRKDILLKESGFDTLNRFE